MNKGGTLILLAALTCSISSISQAAFIPEKVITGSSFSCAVSTEGTAKCWGRNEKYNLGTGDDYAYGYFPGSMGIHLPTVNLGTDIKIKDICAGSDFACAATTEGKVKCWGRQYAGALGQGSFIGPTQQMGDALPYTDLGEDFYASSLACTYSHVCALSDKGNAKCWGANDFGQLGTGDLLQRGNKPGQMGNNLPFLKTSKPIRAITAGFSHSCALFDEGIKCWGWARDGQLGQQNETDLGGEPGTRNLDKIPVIMLEAAGTPIKIKKITSGRNHNCALYELDGINRVKCRGENYYGALGLGSSKNYGNTPNSMGEYLPPLDVGFSKITDIQSYDESTCALSSHGQLKCWGSNTMGQLGLGDELDRGNVPNQTGTKLPIVDLGLPVKALSIGGFGHHHCAILVNSNLKCWGYGFFGQLGYEDNRYTRGADPDEMGEFLPFVKL